MSDVIARILSKHSILPTGDKVADPDGKGLTYIFVEVGRDSKNRQVPSNAVLKTVQDELSRRRKKVEFILVDARSRDLETGLRATILSRHGSDVRNVYMSVVGKKVSVWIEPKRRLSDAKVAAIKSLAGVILEAAGLVVDAVILTTGAGLPSRTVCLQQLRLLSPANPTAVADALKARNLRIPSEDWMKRRLDSMRKRGDTVRNPDGKYSLSATALRNLGTKKDRTSPDIRRLLEIASGRR